MKVAIVHGSAAVSAALRRILETGGGCQVVWTAAAGEEALALCRSGEPAVVLVDAALPGAAPADLTRDLLRYGASAVVVLTDPRTPRPDRVFEAMGAGALDAVPAPAVGADGRLHGDDELVRKVRNVARVVGAVPGTTAAIARAPHVAGGRPEALPPLVAIGASTGGPAALVAVIGSLPATFPGAVVAVQHVDAQFSADLALWLGGQVALPVHEAGAGHRPAAGKVLLAGGDRDLVLGADLTLRHRRPRDGSFYHPSVDVFFASLAEHWPDRGVAALLTGIGRDGAEGLLALRRTGWHTMAQDEATSVVHGMPRAAAELGAAVEVLPLHEIGPAIARRTLVPTASKRGTRG